MTLENVILYTIIIAVVIVVPILLAKKAGQDPIEVIFGRRLSGTLFGKKNASSEAEGKEPEDGSENAGLQKDTAKPSAQKSSGRSGKSVRETNSSKSDLVRLISKLATYARKNHFRLIVPGTVTVNGTTAALAAILITRCGVVGINCFGFGGSVSAGPGDDDWTQTMNGEKISFPSPVKKNRQQREIVQQALADAGWANTPVEIIGVFTSPTVRLSKGSRTNCYTKVNLFNYLYKDRFLKDGGIEPERLEAALEPMILRSKKE